MIGIYCNSVYNASLLTCTENSSLRRLNGNMRLAGGEYVMYHSVHSRRFQILEK